MALFKKTTTKKKAESKKATVKTTTTKAPAKTAVSAHALVRPHITEKSAILAEKNTYVFEVSRDTNKIEIAKAVHAIYGVKPVRVNIVNLPATRVVVRGRAGVTSGVRKALVTLAKGDSIELM